MSRASPIRPARLRMTNNGRPEISSKGGGKKVRASSVSKFRTGVAELWGPHGPSICPAQRRLERCVQLTGRVGRTLRKHYVSRERVEFGVDFSTGKVCV